MKLWLKKIGFGLREIVALAIWLLIITKLFVYDVDLLLVQRIGWLQRFYPYKFFFIVAAVAVVWLILGGKYARKIILFIAVYPIILLWRLIVIAFKNWATLLLFAPALESMVRTFKWRFILSSFAILAALGIALLMRPITIMICMGIVGSYLISHYVFRFRGAYRQESIFASVAPTIGLLWETTIKTFKDAEAKVPSNEESPEAKKQRVNNLKTLYSASLLYTYVAGKLRQSVASRRTDLYFLVALVYTFVLTIVTFGFEYWALFKINPSSFQVSRGVSGWAFFLFSFNAMLHTSFATIAPSTGVALLFANLELLAGIIIGLFLVFILLTSQRERYRQDLSNVIDGLARSATQIEGFLLQELGLQLIDVEVRIIEEDPTFSSTMQSFGRTAPSLPKSNPTDNTTTKS
jgi:hypothetical protein